jgi:hypothetical protein
MRFEVPKAVRTSKKTNTDMHLTIHILVTLVILSLLLIMHLMIVKYNDFFKNLSSLICHIYLWSNNDKASSSDYVASNVRMVNE